MIHIIEEGDIFAISGVYNYAHGCNCAGAMGKGIALQFKDKFPEMYLEYKNLCKENKFNPGDVFDYYYGHGYVYNLGTQLNWRTSAKLEYISTAIEKMCNLAIKEDVYKIAMPTIGAGLGGLKWMDVKQLIFKIAEQFPMIDLFIVEKFSAPNC